MPEVGESSQAFCVPSAWAVMPTRVRSGRPQRCHACQAASTVSNSRRSSWVVWEGLAVLSAGNSAVARCSVVWTMTPVRVKSLLTISMMRVSAGRCRHSQSRKSGSAKAPGSACDEDAYRILSAPGQAVSALMIRLSGRWEEPGEGTGQKLSLPGPPQVTFVQLGCRTVAQNRP
jgi:hypothetical protein